MGGQKLREVLGHNGEIIKFTLVFGPPFTTKPLFQWYSQSKEILLNLGMIC
jgi:hypothetical protein